MHQDIEAVYHAVEWSRFKMGSVGNNFKCPICGRMGHGGYAFDNVGYPTCSICNFKQAGIANGVLPAELVSQQLLAIAGNKECMFRNLLHIDAIRMLITTCILPKWFYFHIVQSLNVFKKNVYCKSCTPHTHRNFHVTDTGVLAIQLQGSEHVTDIFVYELVMDSSFLFCIPHAWLFYRRFPSSHFFSYCLWNSSGIHSMQ